jgi:hypothetical protein
MLVGTPEADPFFLANLSVWKNEERPACIIMNCHHVWSPNSSHTISYLVSSTLRFAILVVERTRYVLLTVKFLVNHKSGLTILICVVLFYYFIISLLI